MDQKLTLSELNKQIGEVLESAFPKGVWVVGEISELKENRNGHCYLELIERQGNEIIARSRATIWSYTYRMLKPYFETTTHQFFTSGIKILVQVSVEFHSAFGLSLNIKDIDPVYTVGDMAMQRREIVERLKTEGVFEMNKELQLPFVPQKIAVISSATAAGYQDFINQLENNKQGFRFYTKLFQATMQGTETVPSIMAALERIFQHEDFFDAVVIIRGGGATADLSSFDNYDLAYFVTQFPLPVITGIGHEKDDTIVDLVAHTRLKTPTAVAEFFIAGVAHYYDRLLELESEIVRLTRETLEEKQTTLERIAVALNQSVTRFIGDRQVELTRSGNQLHRMVGQFTFKKEHRLGKTKHQLKSSVLLWFSFHENQIGNKRIAIKHAVDDSLLKKDSALNHFKDQLCAKAERRLLKERERIHYNENTARLIDPVNVLKRGYSITFSNGKLIKTAGQLNVNDELETRFATGKVKSKITKTDSNDS
ncbi:MAG TPA: exodeoxyribonuclease VII large subunit [Prolixibacteraceae bacterium]|nr:exodeoxyribonuclease VII large subunit [Prolixibacteraceae bacterium]